MTSYNPENYFIAKPSELLVWVQTYMNTLQTLENYGRFPCKITNCSVTPLGKVLRACRDFNIKLRDMRIMVKRSTENCSEVSIAYCSSNQRGIGNSFDTARKRVHLGACGYWGVNRDTRTKATISSVSVEYVAWHHRDASCQIEVITKSNFEYLTFPIKSRHQSHIKSYIEVQRDVVKLLSSLSIAIWD